MRQNGMEPPRSTCCCLDDGTRSRIVMTQRQFVVTGLQCVMACFCSVMTRLQLFYLPINLVRVIAVAVRLPIVIVRPLSAAVRFQFVMVRLDRTISLSPTSPGGFSRSRHDMTAGTPPLAPA